MTPEQQALAQAWDAIMDRAGFIGHAEEREAMRRDIALVRAEYDKMRALLDQMTRVGQIGREG